MLSDEQKAENAQARSAEVARYAEHVLSLIAKHGPPDWGGYGWQPGERGPGPAISRGATREWIACQLWLHHQPIFRRCLEGQFQSWAAAGREAGLPNCRKRVWAGEKAVAAKPERPRFKLSPAVFGGALSLTHKRE